MLYKSHIIIYLLFVLIYNGSYGFFEFHNKNYGFIWEGENITLIEQRVLSVIEHYIDQPFDHENKDGRTWNMRFFENLDLWAPGGPILLFIGGESEADPRFISGGLIYNFAQEVRGALYLSEHRYYGKSQPFPYMNTESFQYLTSLQGLGDIARLLIYLKSQDKFKNSRVVVFGGSYPGNLAAWSRLMFPNLVDAALSSSAPVLAKENYFEYLETVGEDFRKYGGAQCYEKIAYIFQKYDNLFQTNEGIQQLKREENICDSIDMNTPLNRMYFFLIKSYEIFDRIQYSTPADIQRKCLSNFNSNESNHKFKDIYWNSVEQCKNYDFNSYIAGIKARLTYLPWMYQTCNEFGYAMTTESNNHPFTNNVPYEFFVKTCMALFGPEFDEARMRNGVAQTNQRYGGLIPNVNRVIFVNGGIDPWHRLGVLHDLSSDVPARFVERTSHCADLRSDLPTDEPEIQAVRRFVKQTLRSWIGV